jgi:glycosyltransferase involved in cell wall biosynthesis
VVGPLQPVVTVLLPTYHRPHHLPLTLRALAVQDLELAWELVVVDNDPGGSAAEQVEQERDRFAVTVRHVVESTRGAASARNRGITEARGAILAMLDDDVRPEPDWLRSLVAPLLAGDAEGSGGRVLLDQAAATPWWYDQSLLGGLLSHFDPVDRARPLEGEEFVVTANAAFDVAALRAMGGFDPALGPNGDRHMVADDQQVVRDLRRGGARIVYTPTAVVHHELPRSRLRVAWFLERAYWQGRSDWLIDRDLYADRRYYGLRASLTHLVHTVATRVRRERPRPALAVRLACDVALAVGAVSEARSWARRG